MANSLYPGFVKMKYSSNGHTHVQVLPVEPDDYSPGVEPLFRLRDGISTIAMNAAIDAWVALIDNLFNTADSFILAEFWITPTVEDDPVFMYAYEIGATGAAVGADVANSQSVMSLRTSGGGILKLYFMEQGLPVNTKDDYPFSNSTATAIGAYLCSPTTGWVIGRDGTFPISPLRFLTKTNDALRKKYILNN